MDLPGVRRHVDFDIFGNSPVEFNFTSILDIFSKQLRWSALCRQIIVEMASLIQNMALARRRKDRTDSGEYSDASYDESNHINSGDVSVILRW